MPVKFEWDLDPGSEDLPSYFSLESSLTDLAGDDRPCCTQGDDCCKTLYFVDHSLHAADCETESEFYTDSGISPIPLPNDDIWKKFDILDAMDNAEFDEELSDMVGDLTNLTWMSPMYAESTTIDAREIRNHDCMWAGHCISEKHDRNDQKSQKCVNLLPIKKQKMDEIEIVGVGVADVPDGGTVCVKKNVVAPTHARSILLPTRIISAAAKKAVEGRGPTTASKTPGSQRLDRAKTLDSGGESPRPETPQSLSDNEDLNLDLSDMKAVEDFVGEAFGYNFINDIVNVGSEDSNEEESGDDLGFNLLGGAQTRNWANGPPAAPAKGTQDKMKREMAKQETPVARHHTTYGCFSDHCYHLNKNARMDNLGVQTPSDSEEEIDVETVYGDHKKQNGRSSVSGGAVLPTNPTLSDRRQLQLTVASAINKKDSKKQSSRTASVPARYSLDERTLKTKMVPCKRKINVRTDVRRTGGGIKRGAQLEDYNEYLTKSEKRKRYQTHLTSMKSTNLERRRKKCGARNVGGGSSDSEIDSIEKRSIHNSMERQRRIDLRNAFEELRKLIPYTAGKEKAAKIVILNCGADFCRSLTLEDSELTRKRAELRRQQEMLMARVSHLRRSLAARR